MTDDWFELLRALHLGEVRFLVVGTHALAIHGAPRATQDIDVWVDPDRRNAERCWRALSAFGAPLDTLPITVEDLSTPGLVVQLGLAPNRVDILTAISGVASFHEAWATRVEHEVRGLRLAFLGREAFVRNKRATGRPKDLADLESLGEGGA
ncbi:MAG: DUF6036 family nucleotidyltransferase [Gemmatimonadota bacterium]